MVNFGKSELSIYYNTNQQYFNEWWFDRNETFIFENGKQYHRHAHTETDGQKRFEEAASLTYNLQDNDNYMFTVG